MLDEIATPEIASPTSALRLAAEAERWLGGIDILVHHARIYSFDATVDASAESSDMVVFLVSDHAGYVNGTTLAVVGGRLAV